MNQLLISKLFCRYLFQILLVSSTVSARLVITELHRDPAGSESAAGGGKTHEFVEFVNVAADTVSLAGVCITNGTEADSLLAVYDTIEGGAACVYNATALSPGARCVVLDPEYLSLASSTQNHRFPFPAGTVLLTLSDNEFGTNGLAADHGVALYRGLKNRIDSLLCFAADTPFVLGTPTAQIVRLSHPPNREGYSVVCQSLLDEVTTFDYGSDSVSPGAVDALLGEWVLEYRVAAVPQTESEVPCTLQVRYCGERMPAAPVGWRIERREEGVYKTVLSGRLSLSGGGATVPVTLVRDTVQLRFSLDAAPAAGRDIDMSRLRNTAGVVRITEIFPRGTSHESEWCELYNCSSLPVSLKNWRMATTEDTMVLSAVACIIEPHAFLVVAKSAAKVMSRYQWLRRVCQPSPWSAFDNSGDTLRLIDVQGVTVDSACYHAAWFSVWPAVSLERIGEGDGCVQGSWMVADRSSPGILFSRSSSTVPHLEIGPIPFTPDNDSHDDLCAITLELPAGSVADIEIYGFDGRILTRLASRLPGVYYWDGTCRGAPAPPGPFFVCARVTSGQKRELLRKKGVLWRKR